jgi:phosphohistidine phosphatase SixA
MNWGRLAVLSALAALLSAFPAHAQLRASDLELAQMLRAGGYVIMIRHGATFSDQADTDPLNPENVAKQRQLNAKGEQAAKALGEAFRSIGIPVSKAVTSYFNRAYQTARLAGFDNVEKTADVSEGGLVVSPNENNRRAAAFRELASTVPPAGTNIVIVSHKPNMLDAFGKDWFEVKEGELTIFKPDGNGYQVIARIQIEEWPRIASAAKETSGSAGVFPIVLARPGRAQPRSHAAARSIAAYPGLAALEVPPHDRRTMGISGADHHVIRDRTPILTRPARPVMTVADVLFGINAVSLIAAKSAGLWRFLRTEPLPNLRLYVVILPGILLAREHGHAQYGD